MSSAYVFVVYLTAELPIHMILYNSIVHCNTDQERSKNQHQMSITKLDLDVALSVYQIKGRKEFLLHPNQFLLLTDFIISVIFSIKRIIF